MPLTHNKYFNATAAETARIITKATKSTIWFTKLLPFMLITLLVIILSTATIQAKEFTEIATSPTDQYDLDQYLNTQTVLIDTLRAYIETLEQKMNIIKRKTIEIKYINDLALTDVHKYVNNPLNALAILKRLTSDWQILQQYALNVNKTTEIVRNLTNTRKSLKFPSESDFDEAASNLLRIQDIYQLEPERLAVGEVNGVKLGSVMSWSDCLEIGRKSVQNGDFMIGKFWMEVALGKLPNERATLVSTMNVTEEVLQTDGGNGEVEKARYEITEALMETEFNMGNFDIALDMVNGMLQKHPKSKYLRKTKNQIEKQMRKSAGKFDKKLKNKKKGMQSDKSVEESLIEEICRETTNIGAATTTTTPRYSFSSHTQHCRLLNGNLPQLLLQPLQVEILNIDPYIVVYHNVLRAQEIDELRELIDEEKHNIDDDLTVSETLKFTKLAQKKLAAYVATRLQILTGHASANFAEWKVQRRTYEDDIVYTEPLVPMSTKINANMLFNLQTSKLGGAIVYPQLEFGVLLPQNALLYWTQLNEYHEYDYRSKQYICPVIAGTQITAFTSIRA